MEGSPCGLLGTPQGLLRELLGALPERGDPRRARVLGAYGAALAGRNLAEDAAVAYLAAGQGEAALGQYRAAGQWRMALALAGAWRMEAACHYSWHGLL